MGTTIQEQGLSAGALDEHIALLELLKTQQAFLDLVGGKAKFHKAVKRISECARSVISILMGMEEVTANIALDPENVLGPSMDKAVAAIEKRPVPLGGCGVRGFLQPPIRKPGQMLHVCGKRTR